MALFTWVTKPILSLALLVGLALGLSSSAEAGTSVPPVSYITATIPATVFSGQTHLACLARSQLAGSSVTTRLFCYTAPAPSPPPPPPPPPYGAGIRASLVGGFDQPSGLILLPILGCTRLSPRLALSIGVGVSVNTGSGSIAVTTDTNGPNYTCDDGTTASGPLSLSALPQSHDQDGDGCTDWNELGPSAQAGGSRDPFNPWDYFNPSGDGINRTDDITAVVLHYGHDDNGDPLYGTTWDRGGTIPGANGWNLLPPDGFIRTADISAAVRSYGHDCGPY